MNVNQFVHLEQNDNNLTMVHVVRFQLFCLRMRSYNTDDFSNKSYREVLSFSDDVLSIVTLLQNEIIIWFSAPYLAIRPQDVCSCYEPSLEFLILNES